MSRKQANKARRSAEPASSRTSLHYEDPHVQGNDSSDAESVELDVDSDVDMDDLDNQIFGAAVPSVGLAGNLVKAVAKSAKAPSTKNTGANKKQKSTDELESDQEAEERDEEEKEGSVVKAAAGQSSTKGGKAQKRNASSATLDAEEEEEEEASLSGSSSPSSPTFPNANSISASTSTSTSTSSSTSKADEKKKKKKNSGKGGKAAGGATGSEDSEEEDDGVDLDAPAHGPCFRWTFVLCFWGCVLAIYISLQSMHESEILDIVQASYLSFYKYASTIGKFPVLLATAVTLLAFFLNDDRECIVALYTLHCSLQLTHVRHDPPFPAFVSFPPLSLPVGGALFALGGLLVSFKMLTGNGNSNMAM